MGGAGEARVEGGDDISVHDLLFSFTDTLTRVKLDLYYKTMCMNANM